MTSPSHIITKHLQEGATLLKSGQLDLAESRLASVLTADPNQRQALHLLGIVRAQKGNLAGAINLLQRATAGETPFPEAEYNLGSVLQVAGQTEEAEHAYQRATSHKAGYAEAWNNLGAVRMDLGKLDGAIEALERAIKANRKHLSTYKNLCRAYRRKGDLDSVLKTAARGLSVAPKDADLVLLRGETQMAQGNLAEGWKAYSRRFDSPDNPNTKPVYNLADWQGEDLADKAILVWTEQGPGETMLFSSMLPELLVKAKRCVVAAPERLHPAMRRSFPTAELAPENVAPEILASLDVQCSLADLGRWLRPDMKAFPEPGDYLKADPEKVSAYRAKYEAQSSSRVLVGLAWKSVAVAVANEKSLPVTALKPILMTPGITFVCTQYDVTSEEIKLLDELSGGRVIHDRDVNPRDNFDDHLAQVAALDLMIASSGTALHAAAAQGIETWAMIPRVLGEGLRWYWFMNGERSPWYPSLRLFRQQVQNDWSRPTGRIAIELSCKAAQEPAGQGMAAHLSALADAFYRAGQMENMGDAASAALKLGSALPNLFRMAALAQREQGDSHRALRILQEGHEANPDDGNIWLDIGALKQEEGKQDEAIAAFKYAQALLPDTPYTEHNLGNLERARGNLDGAIELYEAALSKAADHPEIIISLARAHDEAGHQQEAIKLYDKAIAIAPNDAEAHINKAITLLSHSAFTDGWPEYRWRFKRPGTVIKPEVFPGSLWSGENLAGKHLIVWTEQGLGEEILLATLLPEVIAKTGEITLLCSQRMKSVFRRSFPHINVMGRDELRQTSKADTFAQASLSELAQVFRASADDFNREPQTFLQHDTKAAAKLRKTYTRPKGNGPVIGVSWHSTTPHYGLFKSIDTTQFGNALAQIPATYVCLQYDPDEDDISALKSILGDRFIYDPKVSHMGDMDAPLSQTAAVDGVITVSNTTAHLAGALGQDTWLLVPGQTGRYWYWSKGRDQALWYPSVRLVSNRTPLQWDEPLETLTAQVTLWASEQGKRNEA